MQLIIIAIFIFGIIIHDKNVEIKYLKKKISALEEKLKSLGVPLNGGAQLNQTTEIIKEVPKTNAPPVLKENVDLNENKKILLNDMHKEISSNMYKSGENISNSNIPHVTKEMEEARRIKAEKKKNETRNNTILAIGAAFIVVAALSFLYTTWNTVPSVVKSAVVLILAGVFLGLSKVAGKVFKLTKTARTFFYIAMIYIPICLFSISLFGLAGEYFSINGDGKYIYFSISSFLVMAIYLFFAYKNKDRKLYVSGNVMQLFFMICLSLIFIETSKEVLMILLIYSGLFNLFVSKFEKRFVKEGKLFRQVLSGMFSGIAIIIAIFENQCSMLETFLTLEALINLILIYRENKSEEFYGALYSLSVFFIAKVVNLEILKTSFIIKQIVILLYVIASSYLYNFVKDNKKLHQIINSINIVVLLILYVFTKLTNQNCIDILALVSIGIALSTIEYIKNKREDYGIFAASLIINSIMLLLPDNLVSNEISIGNYLVCGLISIIMMVVLHKDKNFELKFIPLMLFFINLYRYDFIIADKFNLTYLINIISIFVFSILSIKDKKDIAYRITSFLLLIGLFFKCSDYLNICVDTFLTSIWILIQMIFTEGEIKKIMKSLLLAPLVIMYYSMLSDEVTLINYLIGVIQSALCLYVYRKDEGLKAIPLIGFMIPFYSYNIILFNKFDITFLLNILLIVGLSFVSIKDKKDISYRVASFLYLVGLYVYFEISIYVAALITTIWAVIQMLYTEGDMKKIMKGVIIASVSFMYAYILFEDGGDISFKGYLLSIVESLICWFIFSRSKYLKALPILGLIIPLYSYDLLLLGKYDITFLLNIALIAVFAYISINGKKEKIYVLSSFVYLMGLIFKYYEMNIYIKFGLVIVWGVIEYINSNGIMKDLMKVLIASCILGVYINLLEDLELYEITALSIFAYLIYSHVIIRGILKNYTKDYKVLEYLVCVILYLYAFELYKDEIDLAIFIAMQVATIMIAYSKKLGPAFAVTIPAIIINMIYLTKNFWLSIPWWGYLVSVGGILIVFAARNELSERKDIKTVKEKLEKVKNYLDM